MSRFKALRDKKPPKTIYWRVHGSTPYWITFEFWLRSDPENKIYGSVNALLPELIRAEITELTGLKRFELERLE